MILSILSRQCTIDADEAYTYDKLGNRLTSAQTTGNWTYNANNELTGYDGASLEYDANGNTTRKVVGSDDQRFIYDVEDRLIRVEDGSATVVAEYYYDPFGRRLWKNVDGTKTYFLYSDEGLIGEYDATGQEIKTYGWAPDSVWSTDPLFVKISGTYYCYQNDHLGTPQKITATNGSVVWSATYDSFGNCQIDIEAIVNNLRFPGMYFDAETGLYYNLNRYYDPTIGRFLRTDPYGQGLNLYTYCFSNPVNWMDPEGLCAVRDVWDSVSRWYKDSRVQNFVALAGGTIQMIGGAGILLATGWTGFGGAAGAVVLVQGFASTATAFSNLINFSAGVETQLSTSGFAGLVTSSVQSVLGTNNVTANNIATMIDMGASAIAGGIGIMQSRNALGRALSAIDDTATNSIANTTPVLRGGVWDARVANPSLSSKITTAVGVATTTTNSISSQIEYNRRP